MQDNENYPFLKFVKDLAGLIQPYRTKFWIGFFIRLSSDVARLYPVWAISQVVLILSRKIFTVHEANHLILIFIGWGILTLYYDFAHSYSKILGYRVAEAAGLDLYRKALSHIFLLDLAWQEVENSGNKMKRIERGYDGVNNTIRRIFDVLIEVGVNTIGIVIIFLNLDIWLSLSIIFFVVTYYILGTKLIRRAAVQEQIVNARFEDLGGMTFESLNNIQTIKSLAIDNSIMQTIDKQQKNLIHEIRKRILLFQSRNGILNTYELMFEFFVVCFISYNIWHGRFDISLLVLFLGLFEKVSTSAQELSDVTQELVTSKVWVSRTMSILNVLPTVEHPEKKKEQLPYPVSWKTLKIKNINFKYKKRTILGGITLSINRGESVGIVGLSGAGKSTLFKLLLDLYENYDGDIFLDKVSYKNMNRQSYIDHTAVVLQDTELFNMSLRENITLASVENKDPKVTINDAIHMAHLDDVVDNLSLGIETLVGEKGVKLSGGQRQRVGIARALYRNPDILLLDEATSHLDAYSERQIQEALSENLHKFTTIIIAHRLSTIKEVDKIVVLEKGQVKEMGTFKELLARKGSFAKMWHEQKI